LGLFNFSINSRFQLDVGTHGCDPAIFSDHLEVPIVAGVLR
jgi:hypothetical protein